MYNIKCLTKNEQAEIVKLYSSGQVEPKKDGSEYVFSDGVNLFIPGTGNSNYLDFAKKWSENLSTDAL